MARTLVILAAMLGFMGVALGAFGAHSLEPILRANGQEETFQTANRYHMVHALALIGVAWLATHNRERLVKIVGYLLTAGTLIFCGSLYVLAIFNLGIMGAIAPLGGALLLVGWGGLGLAAWRTTF